MSADLDALMARIAGGDERAFAELYDRLAPTLYGIVLRILGEPAQSEEVTREAFVDLWHRAASFDPTRGGACGWAVMIARRRAIERARSVAPRHDDERRQPVHAAPPARSSGAATDWAARDRACRVLAELGATQREALELAYLDGLTHVEVAERLGVAAGAAKTRIRDGMVQLRHLVQAHA